MLALGLVTSKKNRPAVEIAVIVERRDGKWWAMAPGDWGKRGPVWVECEIENGGTNENAVDRKVG